MSGYAAARVVAVRPCGWPVRVGSRRDSTDPHMSWAGQRPGGIAGQPSASGGCVVSLPSRVALHELYGRELTGLLEGIRAGEVPAVVVDQVTAERWLFRLAGALLRLQERHQVDNHGRCSVCRPLQPTWWRPWPKRSVCTVHSALGFFLRQPGRFVLPAVSERVRQSIQGAL